MSPPLFTSHWVIVPDRTTPPLWTSVIVTGGENGGSIACRRKLTLNRMVEGDDASGLGEERARDAEQQDEPGHRLADEAVLPWRSSRQRRTL